MVEQETAQQLLVNIESVLGHNGLDCSIEVEGLRRFINQSHPVPEWQPIETAPADDTRLLLTWWDGLNGRWQYEAAPWSNLEIARRGGGYRHGRATHWMPLPAAPKQESNDG